MWCFYVQKWSSAKYSLNWVLLNWDCILYRKCPAPYNISRPILFDTHFEFSCQILLFKNLRKTSYLVQQSSTLVPKSSLLWIVLPILAGLDSLFFLPPHTDLNSIDCLEFSWNQMLFSSFPWSTCISLLQLQQNL